MKPLIRRSKNCIRVTLVFGAAGLLAILTVLLLSGCGNDQADLSIDTGGKVQLTESDYDFGDVPVNETVEHDYTITNNGTGPLSTGLPSVKRLDGC
ncbi:MAG: hypothetical protein JJD96_02340 [Thermoleophilia bacterium]|nr:hypothetical protein [Thermoleophilia bacterium]